MLLLQNQDMPPKREKTPNTANIMQQMDLIPLVHEHFGRWGKEADDYLDFLSKSSRYIMGRRNEADFRNRWRRQFAIIIQRCNAE